MTINAARLALLQGFLMSKFVIHDDMPVPAPKSLQRQATELEFPINLLEVGQALEFEVSPKDAERFRSRASMHGKRNGKRFVVRMSAGRGFCYRVE